MNALFLAPVLFAFTMVMVIPFFLGIYQILLGIHTLGKHIIIRNKSM